MNIDFPTYTLSEIKLFQKMSEGSLNVYQSKFIEISKYIHFLKEIPANKLIKMIKDVHIVRYRKNEKIIVENSTDRTIYYILLGKVSVYKGHHKVGFLQRGNTFGEVASILNQPRDASVVSENENTNLVGFTLNFDLTDKSLESYYAIIYKNMAIELAKKLEECNNLSSKKGFV